MKNFKWHITAKETVCGFCIGVAVYLVVKFILTVI